MVGCVLVVVSELLFVVGMLALASAVLFIYNFITFLTAFKFWLANNRLFRVALEFAVDV